MKDLIYAIVYLGFNNLGKMRFGLIISDLGLM